MDMYQYLNTRFFFSLLFMLSISLFDPNPLPCSEGLSAKIEGGQITVSTQNNPLLVYLFMNTPMKPYMQGLYSLSGKNVLRDNVADHLHHHGLMFALKVNDTTFWEENAESGKQVHKSLSGIETKVVNGRGVSQWSESLVWVDPKGDELLAEERSISVRPMLPENASLLTWSSQLHCPQSKPSIEISGNHYYGLGMRFVEEMDEVGRFINASEDPGTIFRGEERLMRGAWCAYTVPGDPGVTVCMFDHPDNVKPGTWFTMKTPFAYLSATLRYHEEKIVLTPEKGMNLKYGVAVIGGETTHEEIENLRKKWLELDAE